MTPIKKPKGKTAVPDAVFSDAAPEAPKKRAAKKVAKTAPATKAKTKTKSAPAAKKAAAPAKKAVGKKTTAAPTTKDKVKKEVSKARGGQSLPRDLNEHGFVKGSDSEKIVDILLAGGSDRADMNSKVLKAMGNRKSRNGTPMNTSSLIANIIKRLRDKGYTIESTWVLVPPTPASKAAATRRAKKAAAAAEKATSTPASTTGRVKKVAKKTSAKK